MLTFRRPLFLSAVYADSLFIALAVERMAARHTNWWLSGGFAALAAPHASLRRLAMIPMLFEMWRARATLRPAYVLSLIIAPAAFWCGPLHVLA